MYTSTSLATLLFFLCQCIVQAWGSATLVPPSTFPPPSTTQTSTGTLAAGSSSTGTSSTHTSTATGSANATSSASTTSTAQFPSLSGVSSCVSDCLASGISRVGCTSVVDVNCFCVQPNFTAELVDCILANCSDQVSTSESLAQQFCNIASTSPTLTFPPVPTTTTSTSTSATSTSAASTSTAPVSTTSASSAGSLQAITAQGTLLGLALSTFGVMLGAFIGL